MLPLLKDILDNKEDAYARALAAAEEEISRSGGNWFGVGAKGSFLLLRSGTYVDPIQGSPYARAGQELLNAALSAAKDETSLEAHLLHFLAGCALAGAEPDSGRLRRATDEFGHSDMGRNGLADWCPDWCRILLASAAMETGDDRASRAHFKHVADRDPARAAAMFERWTGRKT